MRAETPRHISRATPADHQKSRFFLLGRCGERSWYVAVADHERIGPNPRIEQEATKALISPDVRLVLPVEHVTVRKARRIVEHSVNHRQLGAKFRGKAGRPTDRFQTLRPEVHGAHDVTDIGWSERRHLCEMGAGPYWAFCVMQDLGGDRAEKEPTKGAVSVSGHENQL